MPSELELELEVEPCLEVDDVVSLVFYIWRVG